MKWLAVKNVTYLTQFRNSVGVQSHLVTMHFMMQIVQDIDAIVEHKMDLKIKVFVPLKKSYK